MLMHVQEMKPAIATMLRSQLKTSPPEEERFMNPNRPKAAVTLHPTQGTPLEVVRLKHAGALCSSASPTRMREPE